MEFLFRHRGEGKRQVKPSQDIALLGEQIAVESSDDSDYVVEDKKRKSNSENSSNSSGGDNASTESDNAADNSNSSTSSEDGGEASEAEAAFLQKNEGLTTKELLELSKKQIASSSSNAAVVKVCGCCLGTCSSDANEIVDCDGCGISVHEGCYGIADGESSSVASTVSSASTEPWFCEPCRAGFSSPPSCELCPVTGGVYKETDVGRWVHLVCALYVPGVAFGDADKLCHVTIFEMNYAVWGRKACMLCSSNEDGNQTNGLTGGARFARTGVCVQCDAGMCKSFFHVSCAHAAGLLSEPSYNDGSVDNGVEHDDDAYLVHCLLHSDRQLVRKRRRAFLIHHLNWKRKCGVIRERWMLMGPLSATRSLSNRSVPGETAEERTLRKLNRKRNNYNLGKAQSYDPWLPTQKLPRLLTTSAGAIRKIQMLGALQGLDVGRQQKQEIQLQAIAEARKRWHVPPGFSVDFVAYYEDREQRISDLKDQVSAGLSSNKRLAAEDNAVRVAYGKANMIQETNLETNEALHAIIYSYRSLLTRLGGEVPPEALVPALKPLAKSLEIVTPSVKARATVYSRRLPPAIATNVCGICKKAHDQHLLAHCDTCKLFYHLSCLTPPITRIPKKSKLYGWSCSECYPDSSSAEEEVILHEDVSSEVTRKRNQSRRLAANKALIEGSSRHSSDFETEWPTWAIPSSPAPVQDVCGFVSPSQKKRGRGRPRKCPLPSSSRQKDKENETSLSEDTVALLPMSLAKVPKDELYPSFNGQESTRQALIDKVAAKTKRKEAKRAEKYRRKLEKKKRKKMLKEAKRGEMQHNSEATEEISEEEEDKGKCTEKIRPKPIKKLKINLASYSNVTPNFAKVESNIGRLPSSAGETSTATPPPAKLARKNSTTISGGNKGSTARKDSRTKCDKCSQEGSNLNLVRCDDCKRCFHFACLVPPIKKSPKVAGYIWSCCECAPSDVDLDWHLD